MSLPSAILPQLPGEHEMKRISCSNVCMDHFFSSVLSSSFSFGKMVIFIGTAYVAFMTKLIDTRRNEPAYLKFVTAELARCRRCPESVIRRASVENACRLFDIEVPV